MCLFAGNFFSTEKGFARASPFSVEKKDKKKTDKINAFFVSFVEDSTLAILNILVVRLLHSHYQKRSIKTLKIASVENSNGIHRNVEMRLAIMLSSPIFNSVSVALERHSSSLRQTNQRMR